MSTTLPGIYSLASGSRANCTLVSDGETHILIDLGVSVKYLTASLKEIGLTPSDISALFITHEHSDHVAGINVFLKKYSIPVHITEPSYLAFIRGGGFEIRDRLTVHEDISFTEQVGNITVRSIPVPHDSAACVAYKVTGNGLSLGICTDIGKPSDTLLEFFSDCTDVITEANHDVIMLKCGIYPDSLKYRILSDCGHTSNDDCADFVVRLARAGVKNVLLSHISPENNTHDLALFCVNKALEAAGVSLNYLGAAPRLSLMRFPPEE
jgi:phosphoribosyl 1,2-cyclic phosphodiesterase